MDVVCPRLTKVHGIPESYLVWSCPHTSSACSQRLQSPTSAGQFLGLRVLQMVFPTDVKLPCLRTIPPQSIRYDHNLTLFSSPLQHPFQSPLRWQGLQSLQYRWIPPSLFSRLSVWGGFVLMVWKYKTNSLYCSWPNMAWPFWHIFVSWNISVWQQQVSNTWEHAVGWTESIRHSGPLSVLRWQNLALSQRCWICLGR